MKISAATKIAGAAVIGGFIAVIAVNAIGSYKLRVGGEVYERIIKGKDLVGDILPPPAYIIEPYLEVTLAVNDAQNVSVHRARLAKLHKEYEERLAYWRQQNIDPAVRDQLAKEAAAPAAKFWSLTEDTLLPALEKGNVEAARQAYAAVTEVYNVHRAKIDETVAAANRMNAAIEADAASQARSMDWASWCVAAVVLLIAAGSVYGVLLGLVNPLKRLKDSILELGTGNYGVELGVGSRSDELGDMGRALETMTANLRATADIADTIAQGDLAVEAKPLSDKDTLGIAMKRMTANLRATAAVADTIAQGDLSVEVKPLSEKDTLGLAMRRMTANLRGTAALAGTIAQGDLSAEAKPLSDKDILGLAMQRMTANLRATAKVADSIAQGDLSTDVRPLSDKDTLGLAMQRMTANLRATAKVADTIAQGDLSVEVRPQSDKDALGVAMQRMVGNLRGTAKVADAIAQGDLTVDAKPLSDKDTLGLSLKGMVEKLRTIVSDALDAAENVSSGSQELSASAEELSAGASEQAAAGEEASSAMEQMAANIKQNADNAAQTEKIARQSAQDAEASGQAVIRAVQAMQTIAGKITIVQEIARQTDLLALNAAVEAARAGEHGKGFAVVASEVRKLAERSQVAAQEIAALSGETTSVAQQAGDMLAKLVPDIKKTAQLIEEISAACREQDMGADQVNQAIQQLDKVIQQNTGASEQMSATSEELSAQAEQLEDSISFFRIGGRAQAIGERREHVARSSKAPQRQHEERGTIIRKAAKAARPAQAPGRGRQPLYKERNPGANAGASVSDNGTSLDLAGGENYNGEFERY